MNKNVFRIAPDVDHFFGLIGDPVAHSFSPLIWNKAFTALSYPAVYHAFKVTAGNLKNAVSGLIALGFTGINVTRPHKTAVASLCNHLHGAAKILQTVNTIKFVEGQAHGYNTDAIALEKILRNFSSRQNALILGNGGAATAVLYALQRCSLKKIVQVSRQPREKPDFAGSQLTARTWNKANLEQGIEESEIVINTTPLGWNDEDRLPELETKLNKQHVFIDVNYNLNSKLLIAARENGSTVIDGREPLLIQALESFRILTGLEPPEKIMRSCIF
ncbi:MAG: shikimate dehydrogenase family protein [Candidatus Rifleibacteriota bacterium]